MIRLIEINEEKDRRRDRDARSNVDQKQPVPRIGVAQVAADRRSDRRRQRCDKADDRRDDSLLRTREEREGYGEHARDHAAADEALHRAIAII